MRNATTVMLGAEYNYAEKTAMTYVYDGNGNIVSKTPYTNVTSTDLSSATKGAVISYTYGDSNWSDKLTAYNGQTVAAIRPLTRGTGARKAILNMPKTPYCGIFSLFRR